MVKSVTPIAGFDEVGVHKASSIFKPPHSVGTIINADNGRTYIYARASADIAASTVSELTEPDFTMAAGAGDWTSPPVDIETDDYAWFKRTDI